MNESPSLTFQSPAAKDYADVLELALHTLPDDQRSGTAADLLQLLHSGDAKAPTLVEAVQGSQRVGCVLGHALAGRVAAVWPPYTTKPGDTSLSTSLLAQLEQQLLRRKANLMQVVLPNVNQATLKQLMAAGFQYASDLCFVFCDLNRDESNEPEWEDPDNEAAITLIPNAGDDRDRLAHVIQATYVDSQDLPALDQMRSIDDVMEGYVATGTHRPEWWFILRHHGQDVGCLLLADHPEQITENSDGLGTNKDPSQEPSGNAELMYMGITPAGRGNGLGRVLVQTAIRAARQAGRRRLLLAADLKNKPALQIYEQAGFVAFDQRSVFLKPLQ